MCSVQYDSRLIIYKVLAMRPAYLATLCSALLLCCHVPFAQANDSSVGDDNGGLILTEQSQIRMQREQLLLSETGVDVRYQFINESAQDLTIDMAFPMPAMYFGMSDHNSIRDFTLWVNDKVQQTQRRLVVLLDGRDIWPELQQRGWDEPRLLAMMEEFAESAEPPGLPASWLDANGAPRFTLHEYFLWRQHFPAGQPVRIRHHYVPSITTGVPQPGSVLIEEYAKLACLDQATRAGIARREGEYGVGWSYLRYILTTANNWHGAIDEFHLIIKKQAASDLLSLCFAGELQKRDALTFEYHARHFQPAQDLGILFIRKAQ